MASSPWMGDSWESIVKLTKRSLKLVLKDRRVYEESLRTFLIDVEFTLNSSLLLPLSDDINDLDALTPIHFLTGTRPLYFNPNIKCKKIDSQFRWKAVQALSKMFWDCFVKEYLPSLQIRAKWNKPTRSLTINDMVLVKDNNLARLKWKLGRVIEVYAGRHGVVRSAKIKLSETILIRPANKLSIRENVK